MEKANRYAGKILNDLLDRFERGSLYRDNPLGRRPFFYIRPETLPEYFDDTTALHKININETLVMLEEKGFIQVYWHKFEEGNLVEKVALNPLKAGELYGFLNRSSRAQKERKMIEVLSGFLEGSSFSLSAEIGEPPGKGKPLVSVLSAADDWPAGKRGGSLSLPEPGQYPGCRTFVPGTG